MGYALAKNNAYSTLAVGISDVATTLTVATGTGARFPTISSGNYFYATIFNTANDLEIVKVIGVAGDVFTIVRGQDGTTAKVYLLGDRIELRPTAALFNDKMPISGGAFTGAVAVPSGATGTQVPQIQEVIKKSGDTMTGPLTLDELRGNGGVVDLPTGNRISGADTGSLVAPGMVVQFATLRVDTLAAYAVTTSAGTGAAASDRVIIDELDITFTPKFADSKVLIQYMITGEGNTNDAVWMLLRDTTIIGRNANGTARWVGFAPYMYDGNNDSTPQAQCFMYVDAPGTTSAVTYHIAYQPSSSGVVTRTFYLNRSVASTGQSNYEVGISLINIMEIAQ